MRFKTKHVLRISNPIRTTHVHQIHPRWPINPYNSNIFQYVGQDTWFSRDFHHILSTICSSKILKQIHAVQPTSRRLPHGRLFWILDVPAAEQSTIDLGLGKLTYGDLIISEGDSEEILPSKKKKTSPLRKQGTPMIVETHGFLTVILPLN